MFKSNHAKLIERVYPSVPTPKPNSSELSYLTYYAASKPAKLVKVGDFLQRKVEKDVRSKGKRSQPDVIVTLDTVKALIIECKDHLNYFSKYAIHIIKATLSMHDREVLDKATATFATLTLYFDGAAMSSQSDLASEYNSLIKQFAAMASTTGNSEDEKIDRYLGTGGLQSALTSNALFTDQGNKHIQMILPALLTNISPSRGASLDKLRDLAMEDEPSGHGHKRDDTVSSTLSNTLNPGPLGAMPPQGLKRINTDISRGTPSGQDTAYVAYNALKQFFRRSPAPTIREGMSAIFSWLDVQSKTDGEGWESEDWCCELVLHIISWVQIPSRYVPSTAILDTLVSSLPGAGEQSPETPHPKSTTLMAMISRSFTGPTPLNGLSVMDVLNTMLALIIRRLQVRFGSSAPKAKTSPASPTSLANGDENDASAGELGKGIGAGAAKEGDWLLGGIVACVGGLASHVYYSNQIADMVTELIGRLEWTNKRIASRQMNNGKLGAGGRSVLSAARWSGLGMRGGGTGVGVTAAGQELPIAEGRKVALECIAEILRNSQTSQRRRVPLDTWQDTTGIIADSDYGVRLAYGKALSAFLTSPADAPRKEDTAVNQRFLSNLHVGLYDLALLPNNSTQDFYVIVNLLETLAKTFGAQAIIPSVPLVFGLQDAAKTDNKIRGTNRRAAIASSVVLYLQKLGVDRGISALSDYVEKIKEDKWTAGEWAKFFPDPIPPVQSLPESPTTFESSAQDPNLPPTVNHPIDRSVVNRAVGGDAAMKAEYEGDLGKDLGSEWRDVLKAATAVGDHKNTASLTSASDFRRSASQALDTILNQPTRSSNRMVGTIVETNDEEEEDTTPATSTAKTSSTMLALDNGSVGRLDSNPVGVENLREALGWASGSTPVQIVESDKVDASNRSSNYSSAGGSGSATITGPPAAASAAQAQALEGGSMLGTSVAGSVRRKSHRVTRNDVKDLLDSIAPAIKENEANATTNGGKVSDALASLTGGVVAGGTNGVAHSEGSGLTPPYRAT